MVALWRYERRAPVPVGADALALATRQLIAGARAQDAGLKVIRTRAGQIGSSPAVELDAFERIEGQLRRVRSIHVWVPGDELVVDEYAPPAIFHAVDHAVFSPVRHSLRVTVKPAPPVKPVPRGASASPGA